MGVKLNLFQVADIISLIPGITRRLKPLCSAKADQPLLTGYISFSRSDSRAYVRTYIAGWVLWSEHDAPSCGGRTKHLWSRSIFGLLMDLLPFAIGGAVLADWSTVSF